MQQQEPKKQTDTPSGTVVIMHAHRRWADRKHTKHLCWCGEVIPDTNGRPPAGTPVTAQIVPCALCAAAQIVDGVKLDQLFQPTTNK